MPDQASIPALLSIGEARSLAIGSEQLVAVGTAPHGFAAILSATDWETLKCWKLGKLIVIQGRVRGSDGRSNSRPVVARFLHPRYQKGYELFYRNGNPLDLRRSNLAFVPRGLLAQAEREAKTPPIPSGVTVTLRDGRQRAMRKRNKPRAKERIAKMLAEAR